MSEPYSDEVPTEPRVYWVRDRETDCEMHGTCAGGGIWYINGGKYHGDAALVDFQFGPAIPTAAELAELREKAELIEVLLDKTACLLGADTREKAFAVLKNGIVTAPQNLSPYGWPREAGKDGE